MSLKESFVEEMVPELRLKRMNVEPVGKTL